MDTVRIELGGNDYAIVYCEMKHKTSRLVRDYFRKFMKPRGKPVLLSEVKDNTKILNEYELDTDKLDMSETTEIILLNQVESWSFGEVDKKTLDNIAENQYEILSNEVDKLYCANPLALNK